MKKKLLKIGITSLIVSLMLTGTAFADPGDDDSDFPSHISIDNWQTWYPKVTALRSLNAYLATDRNQKVYYVPMLEELPDVKNAVSDCTDYAGSRQRFAAVYDGYFDQMCYEALVRKSDGSYSNVPAIVQTEGSNSVRELTTLGYDFLLTSESLSNVVVNGENVSANYSATKLDRTNGYVDLNTALMDIYKAVGQSKYDIIYAFTEDESMTVENSPIQQEINLLLDGAKGVDTSAGAAWVFATRTNPNLYWKQAAYDGIIWDAEALHNNTTVSGASNTKTEAVTLGEFCMYAYNIMNIYGEPVITQSERNILLQLYGSTVPYKACSAGEVEAIETLIAKGIICPDEDEQYLVWNGNIDFDYMLTLLMRISDVNARKTYKDVQITMDVSMINNNYYNAKLEYEDSNIVEIKESKSAAQVTNYYDARLGVSQFENMAQTINTNNVSMDLFIPTHLVFVGPDGAVFPLTTQVTTYTQKVYSTNHPGSSYVLSNYDPVTDGQLMQFCISDGIQEDSNSKFLHLRIASFTVQDLVHSDGTYHLHLVNDRGELSSSAFAIKPGGGIYYESGIRSDDDDDVLTDRDSGEVELSNTDEIDELIALYEEGDLFGANRRLREMLDANPNWTIDEVEAAEYAASNGEYLSSDNTSVMYMTIVANSENNITVRTLNGAQLTLASIMSNQSDSQSHMADPSNPSDLIFRKVNATTYQVDNCKNTNDLNERVRSQSVQGVATAYCKRDQELLVSTEWLRNKGIISTAPIENGDMLMLSTQYSNIYLDKKNQYIVVGACVYDVQNLDQSEIWFTAGSDTFVNFRAVLGWTGDFMIFKNTGGSISVSILDSTSFSPTSSGRYAVNVRLLDILKNDIGVPTTTGNTVAIQGYSQTANDKTKMQMTGLYPFANYFIYVASNVLDTSEEYHDWLFVFKQRDVKVNGTKLDYDDTDSRKFLRDTINVDLNSLDSNVTVWAYPLYRTDNSEYGKGMPRGMTYSDKYGYIYRPEKATSAADVLASYFNTEGVLRSDGSPEYVLPFYVDSNDNIRCFNYNVYVYQDADGNDVMMNYGEMPAACALQEPKPYLTYKLKNKKYTMYTDNLMPDIVDGDSYGEFVAYPAVTSPALWFLELQKYDFQTVMANQNNGTALYWGTSRVNVAKKAGKWTLSIGSTDVTSKLEKMNYLLMRETASKTSTIGRWFSVSALSAFELKPVGEDGTGTEKIVGPTTGRTDSVVDVIDWDEFKLSRILENGEFAVSIVTVIVLNIMPRIALFAFLLLTALGVIQNVKLFQLFCDRIFDPFKFLTAGRKDVHTFRSGRAFITSIVAMAIYALFMDGTIIHVIEWLMQFIGAFLGR